MRSAEVYRELGAGLRPYFRSVGFGRGGGRTLSFYREPLLVFFQLDKWGFDRHAGSGFYVNLQRSGSPQPWTGNVERITELLSDEELAEAQRLQNEVIARLTPPPAEHLALLRAGFARISPDPERLFEGLLGQFRPLAEPLRRDHDFQMRYHSARDIAAWCRFLLPILPRAVDPPVRGA